MDDFDDFLKSVPVTPAKANDVRTAPTSSSDDALDDFFTDMGIPPKQSTSGTDGNLDQLLSEAVTPKQSESQQLPILKNDNIIYDKSNLEQLPSSASPDASRKVDIIRDSAIVSSDSLQVGKHAATVTPKLQSTTYNDDFDELFGDTTPVKVVDATQQIATPTVSDEKSLDLNVSKVPGDGVVINSTIPVVTPAKVSNTSELVTATYTTEFEELFGNTTPIAASGSVIGITATERKNSSVGVQLGNEIQTPVTAAPSTPSATSVKSAKKESTDDDLDFLSWLGDSTTPVKSPSSNTGTNPGARLVVPGDAPASLSDRAFKRSSSYSADSGLTTPTQAQSKVKALMDNFFDDLFGGISKAAPIIDQDAITKVKMSNADFERQVCEMINSSFIDVPTLRTFLREGGYIPSAYRGQVLCSLLTGDSSINEDPELEDTEGLSLLASKFNNHAGMISDCNIMTSISYCDESSSSRIRQDLQDIITLYCIRKEREYSSVLCSLLAPLLLAPNSFSKELSSSCFYCLVSDFVPLLSLQSSGIEAALRTVHSWLRLLVVYHSPAVAQHLDRTIPGWEKAASFTGIALVGTGDLKGEVCPGVDKEAAITSDTEIDAKEEGGTWTDKGSTKPESWGIPLQWICGLFSGSIPVENSSFLLDWALISQQRYAGKPISSFICGWTFSNS